MNRFLVFSGDNYYPRGGWHDVDAGFDDEAEAIGYAKGLCKESLHWAHVVDTETRTIVFEIKS
jgi:hypothetical protein